jgi:hypothetical protein
MVNEGADYSCFDYYNNSTTGKVACMWATGLEDSAYWIGQDGVLVTLTFVANDSISEDSLDFSVGSILDGGSVVFAASNSDGYYAYDNVAVDEPITVEIGDGTSTTTEATTTEATEEPEEPTDTTTEATEEPEEPADTTTEATEEPEEPADTTTSKVTDAVPDDTTAAGLGDSDSETVLGDANLDGDVNAVDLLLVKKHVLGISELTGQALINADVVPNNDVAANDLLLIRKYVLGMISSFE